MPITELWALPRALLQLEALLLEALRPEALLLEALRPEALRPSVWAGRRACPNGCSGT